MRERLEIKEKMHKWKKRTTSTVRLWSQHIRVITKLPNSEQFYKAKVKTHNCINRQNQSTTGKLWKRNDPDLVQAFLKKWRGESDFKAPNLPPSLRLKGLARNAYSVDILDIIDNNNNVNTRFWNNLHQVRSKPKGLNAKWP